MEPETDTQPIVEHDYVGWYDHGPADICAGYYASGRTTLTVRRQHEETILLQLDSDVQDFRLHKALTMMEAYKID